MFCREYSKEVGETSFGIDIREIEKKIKINEQRNKFNLD